MNNNSNVTPFARRVYDAVVRIPRGRVATYGQIAEIIGCEGGTRAVGNALHVNPFAPAVPCHRVVACDGALAGHFGDGGPSVQYARLEAEGVQFLPGTPRSGNKQPKVNLAKCGIVIEKHPLKPFLPQNGRILFLGSFPPPKARWSMEFFYPNWINDFWRIQGLVHFGDARHFESGEGKRFELGRITEFCRDTGLAFYDTAAKVCRWKGNASDEFLEILESADIAGMLMQMPDCRTIVTTGGKSGEELLSILERMEAAGAESVPAVGGFTDITLPLGCGTRSVRWWRMPSSSRAFPMALQDKAARYAAVFGQQYK